MATTPKKVEVEQKSLEPHPAPIEGKKPIVTDKTEESILPPPSPKIEKIAEISKEPITPTKTPSETQTIKTTESPEQKPIQTETSTKPLEAADVTPWPWEKFVNIFKGHKRDEDPNTKNEPSQTSQELVGQGIEPGKEEEVEKQIIGEDPEKIK